MDWTPDGMTEELLISLNGVEQSELTSSAIGTKFGFSRSYFFVRATKPTMRKSLRLFLICAVTIWMRSKIL